MKPDERDLEHLRFRVERLESLMRRHENFWMEHFQDVSVLNHKVETIRDDFTAETFLKEEEEETRAPRTRQAHPAVQQVPQADANSISPWPTPDDGDFRLDG